MDVYWVANTSNIYDVSSVEDNDPSSCMEDDEQRSFSTIGCPLITNISQISDVSSVEDDELSSLSSIGRPLATNTF